MAEEKKRLEQNQQEKPMSLLGLTIVIGLFGGVFWSSVAYLAYIFNFTKIRPNVILSGWTIGEWKEGWLGTVIAILLIGILSVGAAIVYQFTLRKFTKMYVGMGYGLVIFFIVYLVLNPIFPGIPPFRELGINTIITSICFYILWGAFVGYSISYEANENQRPIREKQKEAGTV